MSRLRSTISSGSDVPKIDQEPEILTALSKGGYPSRHISHLGRMTGPGLEKGKELAKRAIEGDCLMLLVGDRGPGKTQIATFLAAERKKAGKSVGVYVKCLDLFGEIKATWHDGGKSVGTENDVLRKYRTRSFLVIDEAHERAGSEWESRVFVNILDHRYDNMLATVLIANLTAEQAQRDLNSSILSRAVETGGLVVCDWPSYRGAINSR